MKVLVTGGAGFIGSNLVRGLLARGDTVRVLDSFFSGKRENLAGLEQDIELIDGDLRNVDLLRSSVQGVEAIFHQAAVASVPLSVDDPVLNHQVNVDGTLNLLLAARDLGARRFLFASSSSVYGDGPERVKVEDLPTRCQSPYAVAKLAGEAYTTMFHRVYGLESIALRYFNIFGPRQDPESMYAAVIPRFATRLLSGIAPTIYGDGGQTRDFTHVANVVEANLLGLVAPVSACGRAYNIGCGHSTSLNEIYSVLQQEVGGKALALKPQYTQAQKGDVRDSLASIEAARKALGYTPRVDVSHGIRETIDWYRQNLQVKVS